MTTTEQIRQSGLVAVGLLLLAVLAITVLRLASLPLAALSLGLDAAASGLSAALELPTPPPAGGA